ncbi:hypothetical protein LMG27198_04430 [Methylocystis echinoides]|uniref:Uncharacterized protein n=1 Tax=Methylocystis echinoides TaxID=29468 RepID=A0A9W6GR20_9HYPH|nr:hypothetical protein LMG27198_04430 [Methylocystis echinoides]
MVELGNLKFHEVPLPQWPPRRKRGCKLFMRLQQIAPMCHCGDSASPLGKPERRGGVKEAFGAGGGPGAGVGHAGANCSQKTRPAPPAAARVTASISAGGPQT